MIDYNFNKKLLELIKEYEADSVWFSLVPFEDKASFIDFYQWLWEKLETQS